MPEVDIIAVTGPCTPERALHARRLAEHTGRRLVPAAGSADVDPIAHALARALHPGTPEVVVELPSEVSPLELIGAAEQFGTRLSAVVCVVDIAHLLDDLRRDDFILTGLDDGHPQYTAHALLTATQLEYASTIVVVGAEIVPARELATSMALISALSPHAILRMLRPGGALQVDTADYGLLQGRPGWACVLSHDSRTTTFTDARVSTVHYEQPRPFHPGRLDALLSGPMEREEFGAIIRSAGFCRLATRPHLVAGWEHVGRTIAFTPLAADEALAEDQELLAVGQDLAFVGLDVDAAALCAALTEATLTDAELLAGPEAWETYPDPFPAWVAASDRSE